MRTTYCGLVSETLMGQTVTLMGWAHRRRDHGGVIFIDLRDREGLVQIVCDPDRAESFATAEGVRNEFCLQVIGVVRARPPGTENSGLVSGKIEVLCHALEVLNPSVTPPFPLDDENLSETVRLTHRVLDLRRPEMQKNLRLRYRVAIEVRKFHLNIIERLWKELKARWIKPEDYASPQTDRKSTRLNSSHVD